MNDSDTFFDRERKPSRSETSRPRAVNPRTGMEQSWQQASNYAAPLDSPHGLITWKLRELVKGISLRTDLARMLLTGAAIEDNAKADEIIADALAVMATAAKANEGTAVHSALSRSFLGHEVPSEYMPHVRAFAAELKRNGLTPVATEVTTLCVALGVLGHTDWVVKTVDGRYLILDVKTGKLGDAKRKFAVQCKAYAGAEYIRDVEGVDPWSPIPWKIDQTEAILAHVDPETGATALYRVDLVLGLYGATLAERVRDWSKIEVLAPYVPVHHAVPQVTPHVEKAIGQRVDPTQPGSEVVSPQQAAAHPELYQPNGVPIPAVPVAFDPAASEPAHADFVCRFDGKAASAHPINIPGQFHCISPQPHPALTNNEAFPQPERPASSTAPDVHAVAGPIEVTEPRPASAETALQAMEQHAVSPVAPSLDPAAIDAERAELMKLDKAPLQMMMKNQYGGTDLAHNRQWLADWIIATRRGADNAKAVAFAKSKGTMSLGEGAPAAPRSRAESTPFALKHIAEAATVADIERFRSNIVERSGDHAWTDEMTEAAKVRVAELDAQNGVEKSTGIRVLNQIGQATEPQHIAALWTQVTVGGSVPENWTDELREAADHRLHAIMAAQSSPPANPYGPPQ